MKRIFSLLCFVFLLNTAFAQAQLNGQWTGSITQVNYFTGATFPYKIEISFTQQGTKFTGMAHFYNGGEYAYVEIGGTFDGTTLDIQTSRLDKWYIRPNFDWCTIKGKLTYSESGGYAWLNGNSFGRAFHSGDPCDMDIIKIKKELPPPPKKDSVKTKPVVVQKNVPAKKDSVIATNTSNQNPVKKDSVAKEPVIAGAKEPAKTNETKESEKIVIGKKNVENIYGRKPKTGKTIEVARSKVKIRLSDNATVDGDSISLYFNEEKLLDNVPLTHSARTITVDVQDGDAVNAVILFAENLGKTPPNTAFVEIDDGDRKQTLNLESDLDRCDIIYLKLKK